MIKITSPEFSDSGSIPIKFTCNGGNINPALSISDVLAQTKSLAIVMEDPDAPGGTWNHWLIWNIDPSTSEIGENSVPPGSIQGANSSGKIGYQGPCPPSGTHRYYFKVYALDNKPELPQGATREDFESAIAGHILDEGQLMGKFQAPENR